MCTAETPRAQRGFSSSLCASAVRGRNVHRGDAEGAERLQLLSLRLGGVSQVNPKIEHSLTFRQLKQVVKIVH